MGNCFNCRKNQIPLTFNVREDEILHRTYIKYMSKIPESRKKLAFNLQVFEEIFCENKEFAERIFIFLELYGKQEQFIQKQTLFYLLEAMIKDSSNVLKTDFKNFDRVELLTLISLKNIEFLNPRSYIKKMQVPYVSALQVIRDILSFGRCGTTDRSILDETVLQVAEGIYKYLQEDSNGSLEWHIFTGKLKKLLPGLNKFIGSYFMNKFLETQLEPIVPILNQPSYILTRDQIFLLLMAGQDTLLNQTFSLRLVYSNLVQPGGYNTMANLMVACELPTLILVQHEDQYRGESRRHIFGAISNNRWYNTAQACGDPDDCIFQLAPRFNVMRRKKGKKATKFYCYLNNKHDPTRPNGIGFGGSEDGKNCRIWIDEDFENHSYIKKYDTNYESGELVAQHIQKIQVKLIEVWGLEQSGNIDSPLDENINVNNTEVMKIIQVEEVKEEVKEEIIEYKNLKLFEDTVIHEEQVINELLNPSMPLPSELESRPSFYWQKDEKFTSEEEESQEELKVYNRDEIVSVNGQNRTVRLPSFSKEESKTNPPEITQTFQVEQTIVQRRTYAGISYSSSPIDLPARNSEQQPQKSVTFLGMTPNALDSIKKYEDLSRSKRLSNRPLTNSIMEKYQQAKPLPQTNLKTNKQKQSIDEIIKEYESRRKK